MAFPLKNHLKMGLRDESLDTSHGSTRLCPTVASTLKGGTIILVGSMEKRENYLWLYVALYLYKILENEEGIKA